MKKARALIIVVSIFSSITIIAALTVSALWPWGLAGAQASPSQAFPEPKVPFAPPHYICYRATQPLTIDGRLDEPAWKKAAWTDVFTDIEGALKPQPRFKTQAKMLWDGEYFYLGAELEEPDIWATLTERDSIIFYDNDFEVFIDPAGSTHLYYELEVNAFGTEWDLLLIKPYRDGGPAVHAWDILGLKTKIYCDGTINQPGDKDRGWSVEIAMPWKILKECAPDKKLPRAGDRWRVNFSRVEYRVEVKDGKSTKVADPATGKPLPEDNWVWAPTGLVNIHYPELWGYVQFSDRIVGEERDMFRSRPEEDAMWAVRQVYYKEKTFFLHHDRYTENLADLGMDTTKIPAYKWPPRVEATWNQWEAFLESEDGQERVWINHEGRVIKK
ncbi:MAG TPA: carbohydrate-binding family 9-like protein [Candidatus Desulfaltia sp.]|nr:carbohydrate-binding family 9-like protein [Candidatus Desulfaltia sp.]